MRNTNVRNMVLASLLVLSKVAFAQDISAGKILYQECAACHSINPGENQVGPSLSGIDGRRAGTLEGFRYSNAMKKSGITWNVESLNQFIADPQALVSGGRMPYSGMPSEVDRKNLIAYLKTLH